MARLRNWCAALSLVPLTLLTSHAARATDSAKVGVGAASVLVSGPVLPRNIHLTPTGRYTRDLCDHSKSHYCLSRLLLPETWTPDQPIPPRVRQGGGGGGGGGLGMGPSDVLAAYNIPANTSANGKVVAILDGPDSKAASDLAAYRSQFGLPALPTCAGNPTGSLPACFAKVGENGGASSGEDAGEDSDAETALDMDMISAACPDCSILLVEVGDTQGNIQDSDFVTGVKTARSLGAVATSISLGGGEYGNDPTGFTTPGHLVLAASGDFGYDLVNEGGGSSSPSYPASAPDILAVGGTTLFGSGSSYDEAVWNDGSFTTGQNGQDVTTSGCSTEFSTPSWQASALTGSGCSMRATADLSAAAAFYSNGQNTDIAVYEEGWQSVEGTSASSPMIAGILTRLGLAETISSDLGWVYTNAAAFNDLGSSAYPVDTQGSDTDSNSPSSCGKLCSVGTGWDGPSGVGTPNGTKLAELAGVVPTADAGSSTPPLAGSDSGTTNTPPTTDGGTTTPGGGPDGGTLVAPGQTTTGALGDSCSSAGACVSGICAEPSSGKAAVCTEKCIATDAGGVCLPGFACDSYNLCFPAPPVLIIPDAGATDASSGSSGGCSVSSDQGSSFAGLGWLTFGLVGLAQLRRRRTA